ncbi:DUF2207 family protein [Peptoniphilus catoniae]|uniref:DUF2207 family protein n=1 Tax=Peptoniphilus catoniae TaxID=1660341 RepID=UPI0010FE2AB7|nr:DUF2207 domain-containing protein [Peptoniphilus catoniae]
MRKLKILILSILFVLLIPIYVSAEAVLNSQSVFVQIHKDSTATISNYYDLYTDRGTEYYFPISHLGEGNISLKGAGIKEGEDYKNYQLIDPWNTEGSIEDKAYKYGLIDYGDYFELCFGLTSHGDHEYYLSYDISKIIKKLTDTNMLYFKFINDNLSNPPQKVKIRLRVDGVELNKDLARIWGFGSEGEIKFEDGDIVFESFKPLGSGNYTTILVDFKGVDFTGGQNIDHDFEYYRAMAFEGSDYNDDYSFEEDYNPYDRVPSFGFIGMIVLAVIIPIVVFIVALLVRILGHDKIKSLYKKGDLKEEYYREPPEKDNWKSLSKVLESTNLGGPYSIIRGFILSWIYKGYISPENYEKGLIFKKEKLGLRINQSEINEGPIEKSFFKLFSKAAEDSLLEENEFTTLFEDEDNLDEYSDILDNITEASNSFLLEKGYIKQTGKTLTYSPAGNELTKNLVMYFNYLNDFTLLNERELKEVLVWDKLLIYASLFGISDKVIKELEKLGPELLNQIDGDLTNILIASRYANIYSHSISSSYSSASSSASAGQGGFTSIGGGGGSFGGGSGGGVR